MSEANHDAIAPPSAGGANAGNGGADDGSTESDATSDDGAAAYTDPNLPPESFWLSKDAEYDWFDRHAVYERSESTKVYSNSTNLHSSVHPHSNPSSQRFSGLSKAAILGLPKAQKITYMDSKRMTCNKTGRTSLFPKKRTVCPQRAAVQLAEPGSPKVSCMGRVRSKHGRRRSTSSKRREKMMEKSRSGRDQNQNQNHKQKQKQKKGFYSKVMSIFRRKKGHRKLSGSRKAAEVYAAEPAAVAPKWMRRSLSAREVPVCGETVCEPPGLGGVKRFASGRRSDSWTT